LTEITMPCSDPGLMFVVLLTREPYFGDWCSSKKAKSAASGNLGGLIESVCWTALSYISHSVRVGA
jgi:hypothetical protein